MDTEKERLHDLDDKNCPVRQARIILDMVYRMNKSQYECMQDILEEIDGLLKLSDKYKIRRIR